MAVYDPTRRRFHTPAGTWISRERTDVEKRVIREHNTDYRDWKVRKTLAEQRGHEFNEPMPALGAHNIDLFTLEDQMVIDNMSSHAHTRFILKNIFETEQVVTL